MWLGILIGIMIGVVAHWLYTRQTAG